MTVRAARDLAEAREFTHHLFVDINVKFVQSCSKYAHVSSFGGPSMHSKAKLS